MERFLDRIDPLRAWAITVLGLIVALAAGSLLLPRLVYDRFIWRYFWGPVVADGRGVSCVVREDGVTRIPDNCATATGIVAEPGYTLVSTVSYAVVLVLMLVGVYFLVDRLDVANEMSFLYPIFPYVLLGGALRTVEDASIQLLSETGSAAIPFPYTAFIISPFIYFTVFAVTVLALVVSVAVAKRGYAERFEYPFAGIGTALLVITLAYLGYLAATTGFMTFHWEVPVVTLVGATLITAVFWVLTERYVPEVNSGTGLAGALIVWGHTVDGVANVLSLDWAEQFGLPQYSPKHVVNAGIRDITATVQPAWLSETIGITWPFLPVKVIAAVVVVWLFNDEFYQESPRYTIVLLVTVLAVGLGPGTRDFLRATIGI